MLSLARPRTFIWFLRARFSFTLTWYSLDQQSMGFNTALPPTCRYLSTFHHVPITQCHHGPNACSDWPLHCSRSRVGHDGWISAHKLQEEKASSWKLGFAGVSLSFVLVYSTKGHLKTNHLFSLHTTSTPENFTPWTPSSSSSQHLTSYFNPLPPSPGSINTPAKRKRILLPLKNFPRQLPMSANWESPPITPNLIPCHICHRRPSIHSDLPGYSACEACERQTCYICMRACEGGCQSATVITSSIKDTNGGGTGLAISKRKNVCGKCCVEVGADGRVWCLSCYGDENDRNDRAESDEEENDKIDNLRSGSCIGVEEWLKNCGVEPWSGG